MPLTSQKEEKKVSETDNDTATTVTSVCIICGKNAEYCMRGIPKNTYCKACAEAYFKFLNYLDKV